MWNYFLNWGLVLYQDSSGQIFNLQKSQLFPGNCNARRASMISALLQINIASLPSIYLGVPLFFGSGCHSHFNKILDSIRLRLAGWKTKCLSFASRLTLVRHLLSSIPWHISLVLLLPSKTCLLMERMMRNFLWSANPEGKKSNLIRWKKFAYPKMKEDWACAESRNSMKLPSWNWPGLPSLQTLSGPIGFVLGTSRVLLEFQESQGQFLRLEESQMLLLLISEEQQVGCWKWSLH